MTKVSVKDDKLAVEIHGWDKLWCLKSRLEIPVEHVTDVRRSDETIPIGGVRTLGTYLPGIITAGTFLQESHLVFWNVHDPEKAIAVDLRDEQYSRLVLEVADPAETIRALYRAL